MIRPVITLRRKRILVDIDTQRDFFTADGKACIRNHRRVLANIRRLCAWARLKNIRMVSTVRLAQPNDAGNPVCVAGTDGAHKIKYTVRNKYITFQADGCTDLPREIFREHDQVILCKRCPDPFEEPRADRILSELKVTEFIIFGALAEEAIKKTALGLLARRKNVTILTDAIGYHDREAAEVALRQAEAKGAHLLETKAALGVSHLHLIGVCTCERCQGKMQKSYSATA
jgi:nicotinamidase-related amidase